MKHTAFLLVLISTAAFAQPITKVDPLIHVIASEARQSIIGKAISVNNHGEYFVDCFVSVYNPEKAEAIKQLIEENGGTVRSVIGDIMTASLPLSAIEKISANPEVKYIEAGKPLSSKMDVARKLSNVDKVNAGTNLDARYDGSGVIVGIVDDTRPDYTHADFKDADGKSRVLFYWDKSVTGTGVKEIASSTGLECTKTQIDTTNGCKATTGGDSSSHSTHVAGIAVGDDATYKGIAPGADLIFVYNVETDADSGANLATTIVDDVSYIFAKAASLHQPAVVNLSLGTSLGAHDDTSAMEKALDNLVADNPGRVIVNAAGNENFNPNDSGVATYNGIHAAVDVAAGSDKAFDFAIRSGATIADLGRVVIVDIWLDSTSSCAIQLDGFNFAKDARQINMSAVSAGASGEATDSAGTTLSVNFTDSKNANNGKQHAQAIAKFSSAVSTATMQAFSFDLIFTGTCKGDAWIWPDRNSTVSFTKRFDGTNRGFGYTYVAGDSNRTITIPGSASKLIAVASYMSQATWKDIDGVTHAQTATSGTDFTSLGATGGTASNVSLFSSLGPTPDGRTKPDIAAPGEPIIASASSRNGATRGRLGDATHLKLEGTSMASPHVAGIVALMLEKNPCLTATQVKKLLTDNAGKDSFTGTSLPNNQWGAGKVDALEAMQDVTTTTAENCGAEVSSSASVQTGGGGCQLIP